MRNDIGITANNNNEARIGTGSDEAAAAQRDMGAIPVPRSMAFMTGAGSKRRISLMHTVQPQGVSDIGNLVD